MRLSISNIAWHAQEDEQVAQVLVAAGVEAIEVAPTRIFDDPLSSSPDQRRAEKERWRAHGLAIGAAQSLLFEKPWRLFGPDDERRRMLEYLQELCGFCAALGAGPLVFGAPKARQRGNLPADVAFEIATAFFYELARRAAEEGCCVCIEPNPPAYGCDFINTADEGMQLVEAVDSPGFGLHLDAAGMHLAGEDPVVSLRRHAPRLRHFHLSAPGLALPCESTFDYAAMLAALRAAHYEGFVSLEMRAAVCGENVERVRRAVVFARSALEAC